MEKADKPNSIETYIAGFPPGVQEALLQIRATIQAAAPDAEEFMSYGMPGFQLNQVKIWFAGHKKHIGMYPMYRLEAFEEDLSEYYGKGTKDSLHFPLDKPIPLALIAKIVRFKFKL